MKVYLTLISILIPSIFLGQVKEEKDHGLFYKISLAATLQVNEDYTLGNDDDETFFTFNALFINNTFGYQFDQRLSMGLNVEYDYYSRQSLNFLPVFADLKYNIIAQDDNVFIRAGYGKLLQISDAFENGTTYKIGFGYQIFDENLRNSFLFGLDFSRKRFGFRQQDKLSSVSIFLEFMLF